jgi:NADH-quinone oxidoreductase subunit D
MQEMTESMRILTQLIPMYKESDSQLMAKAPQFISCTKEEMMTQNYSLMQHFVLVTQGMRPPKGEIYVATESPKGELGFMIVSDGSPYPYKMKLRAPSFWHTGLLQDLLPGHQLADVVAIIGNLNIVFGEIDR